MCLIQCSAASNCRKKKSGKVTAVENEPVVQAYKKVSLAIICTSQPPTPIASCPSLRTCSLLWQYFAQAAFEFAHTCFSFPVARELHGSSRQRALDPLQDCVESTQTVNYCRRRRTSRARTLSKQTSYDCGYGYGYSKVLRNATHGERTTSSTHREVRHPDSQKRGAILRFKSTTLYDWGDLQSLSAPRTRSPGHSCEFIRASSSTRT